MSGPDFANHDGKIWYNGEIVDWRDAKVHVLTHGLHYASSVFEGERMYGGNIFKLIAQEGQSLEPDATVLILEAMKMETEIKSPAAGVVTKIFVKPGDSVKPGDPLFEIA